MSKSKRFMKTRIVDKWGGIYDSETDKILNINDVEFKLNELCEENKKLHKDINLYKNESKATIKFLQDELNECEKFRYSVFKKMEELNNE